MQLLNLFSSSYKTVKNFMKHKPYFGKLLRMVKITRKFSQSTLHVHITFFKYLRNFQSVISKLNDFRNTESHFLSDAAALTASERIN